MYCSHCLPRAYPEIPDEINEIPISDHPYSRIRLADALSLAPLPEITQTDKQLQQDADAYVAQVIQGLPATSEKLLEIHQAQEQDNVCQQLVQFCREGWPHHPKLKGNIKLYKPVACERKRLGRDDAITILVFFSA